jgi:urease accessory protein
MRASHLYKLTAWLSPAFPVGAYTYSHGLEFAVESELVRDRASLADWTTRIVVQGSGQVDAVLFRDAWQASHERDSARLRELVQIAAAFRGTREMALESSAQGEAFMLAVRNAWHVELLDMLEPEAPPIAYPVALGAVCGREQIPIEVALQAFLQAFVANLVSAGVRLIPLGQTDGQRVMAQLEDTVQRAVVRALRTPLEEVGTSTPMVDWTSMRHETQHTRLFRS